MWTFPENFETIVDELVAFSPTLRDVSLTNLYKGYSPSYFYSDIQVPTKWPFRADRYQLELYITPFSMTENEKVSLGLFHPYKWSYNHTYKW